jgi:hypothetical protein
VKRTAALILTSLLLIAGAARAQEAQNVAAATGAAAAWLQQLDNADYAGTWEQSAPLFQAAVPKADWLAAM